MAKLYFINGSPRGNTSASKLFIDELSAIIQSSNLEIKQTSLNNKIDYEDIGSSDILIIIFPLYVDSLPSTVVEFLVNLEQYAKDSKKLTRVYGVVNCGFFEAIQTKYALNIVENFCIKAGYEWRFGVGVGAGEFMRNTKTAIPLKSDVKKELYNAFIEIKNDINNGFKETKENRFISPNIPKSLFISEGSAGWTEAAKSMSISEDQLYSKPFYQNEN